jgi:PAS domain S-box-containing protein
MRYSVRIRSLLRTRMGCKTMSKAGAPESPTEEVTRLRGCLDDVVGLMALPAVSTGGEPSQMLTTLLDALLRTLRLTFVFARLNDPEAGGSIEIMRVAGPLGGAARADLSLASARVGLRGEIGIVVAGSERRDFPGPTDRLVLNIAANQVAIRLQQAQLLSEQKRFAAQLDERVAQRTGELLAANQRLKEEISQHQRTAEVLRQREQESHSIIDSIPAGVALMTPDGEIEVANRQMLEYFGRTFEEVKHWMIGEAIHPEDRSHVAERFRRSLTTGDRLDSEQRHLRSDGVFRWFRVLGVPLRDASGCITRWCVLHIDIDERKRAEAARRETERESRLIVDTIPGLVATLTPAGDVDVVNHQLIEYCGQPLEAMRQWGTNGTVHAEDLPRLVQVFTQAITSGEPYDFEARIRRFDGVYRWFQVRGLPLRDPGERIARWYVLLTDIDDRKRAEDALRASERNLKLSIDTIPALAWSASPDGSADFLSQYYVDFSALSAEQAMGWGWTAAVHPDDLNGLAATWQRIRVSEAPGEAEARLRRHDGEYRWFLFRANPLRDEKGNIVRWYGVNTDIEDRKRTEEALRKSERQFRLLVETIPALVWRGTPEGELDYLNRRAVEYLGHTAESLAGGRWLELVHPDHREATLQRWLQSASTGSSYEDEYRLRRADGQYRWIQSVGEPFHDTEGRIANWYGLVIDIEDRKRAAMELRRAYDSFADAQRLSHTGSFITDLVGDDHNWSEEAFRIFEFDPATKVSVQRVRDTIHPDDVPSFESVIARGMKGENVNFAFRIVTARETVKHVRGVAHVVERMAGRPLFVGALQDVTDSRVAEEALNRARSELAHVARVTTVSALTASIAHEVNQPLSGIITNAGTCLRMLAADPPDIEGARETARRTMRDGNRASDVVTRLRALFTRKEFTLEPLDLNEAAREVVALSLSELQRHRIVLQSDFADDLPMITGDRIQLQQVMLNLLRNASDAMVGVDDHPRQLLIRTARDEGDRVRLTVRDAGVGLDLQSMSKLFDAFYTTKTDGMGIGLSVSRSIIERHRGRLWAEPNDAGPGATFSFWIPRATETQDAVPAAGIS